MPRYDASTAQVYVLTFKEGLLSALGHDLKLKVGRLTLDVTPERVVAELDATTLEVVCARKDGLDAPGALPAFAPAEIRKNIENDVLETRRWPTIHFTSTELGPNLVRGTLSLHGTSREVSGVRRMEGATTVVEVQLHQPDFGITPYRGMMGTLKVSPKVVVQVRVTS